MSETAQGQYARCKKIHEDAAKLMLAITVIQVDIGMSPEEREVMIWYVNEKLVKHLRQNSYGPEQMFIDCLLAAWHAETSPVSSFN
jgi:hypothetical protein